jgi:hypothetical protein
MVNNLQFLRSLNAGTKPVALQQGQIAFNLADKLLFVGDGSSNITNKSGTVTGPAVGPNQGYFESDLSILTGLGAANAYTDQKIADLVDSAPELLNTLNELAAAIADDPNFVTTITTAVSGVQTNLNNETARAQAAEAALQGAISSEAGRAAAAEAAIAADLAAEAARAAAAEGVLTSDLLTEVARAQAAEATLTADLAAEAARALAAEGVLTADLATEVSRAQAAEAVLTADLGAEVARAVGAEAALAADIASAEATALAAVSSEAARAQAAEAGLNARLSDIENGIDLGTFGGGNNMQQF